MIGFMHYNKFGTAGFTDSGKARCASSAQTCPVCLLSFTASGGTLPDGTVLAQDEWVKLVCTTIKDETVSGGYQPGCFAGAFPAS
ncbi:MAG: hypothetical protein ACI802_000986 [Candidatus Paceibacteria bacterium]|jgi:hypothetical protein